MPAEEIAITGFCLLILSAGVGAGAWWLLHRPSCQYAAHVGDAIADAQDAVREALDDPWSARFRDVRYQWVNKVVYGEVNARNRAGVYTGFRGFSVVDGDVQLERADTAPSLRPGAQSLKLMDS